MIRNETRLDAGWRRRPMTAEEAGGRLASMLAALVEIDGRFCGLLTGGRGPDRSLGWDLADVSPAGLARLLGASDSADEGATKWTPRWHAGFWNGLQDGDGQAVGIGVVVEGSPSYSKHALRSSVDVNAETDGLDERQREAIVAAVLEAWDPDECTRRERFDGVTTVSVYARGEGWRIG
jgi:hypothetical protein